MDTELFPKLEDHAANKMTLSLSEDIAQPVHPHCLIRVWVATTCKDPTFLNADLEPSMWSEWTDA